MTAVATTNVGVVAIVCSETTRGRRRRSTGVSSAGLLEQLPAQRRGDAADRERAAAAVRERQIAGEEALRHPARLNDRCG